MKRKEVAELAIYDDIVGTVYEMVHEIKRKKQKNEDDLARLEKLARIYVAMEGVRPGLPVDLIEEEADK